MPPTHKGTRLLAATVAATVEQQATCSRVPSGEVSFHISSAGSGEDDEDFIGNDSYNGSPEGSWDSSGGGGTTQRSKNERSEHDDGLAGQDSDSGGDDYADEYQEQERSEDDEHARAGSSEYEKENEFRDSDIERDDDAQSASPRDSGAPRRGAPESPPDQAVQAVLQSQPSLTSGSSGEQDEDGDGGSEGQAGVQAPAMQAPEETTEHEYSFEAESDGEIGKQRVLAGAHAHTGDEHADQTASSASSDREPARNSIAASVNATGQAYMQSRLSMHLLAVDSDEDEEATPRLPSLSARERERAQEHELLMQTSKETKGQLNNLASDEEDDATPRLNGRNAFTEQEQEHEEITPRTIPEQNKTVVPGGASIPHIAKFAAPSQMSAKGAHGGASARFDFSLGHDVALESMDNMLEITVAQVVVQAICDPGGLGPARLLVESSPNVDGLAQEPVTVAQNDSSSTKQQVAMNEAVPLPTPMEESAVVNLHGRSASVSEEPLDDDGEDPFTTRDEQTEHSMAAGTWVDANGQHDMQQHKMQQPAEKDDDAAAFNEEQTNDSPQAAAAVQAPTGKQADTQHSDKDLQTDVTADEYLSMEKEHRPVGGKNFTGYSVKLEGEEKDATRPSSRASSKGSSVGSKAVGRPKSQPLQMAQTRIQMRKSQQELSVESSQVSVEFTCLYVHFCIACIYI